TTVQLRLPVFRAKNPRAWFSQVEAQFHLRHITTQTSRYYHVVSALPPELADELDDILALPPPDDAYDHLKRTILARKTESETSRTLKNQVRLQQLLNTEELGDRRPSQLLHRMRQLLGEQASDFNNPILRELFLHRLPQGMRMALAPAADIPLDRLAEMADRATPSLSGVTNTSQQCSTTTTLEARIDALTAAVADLSTRSQPRKLRRRSSSRHRSSSQQREGDTCWYHQTFGTRARKCEQPCHWQKNAPARH
ncbi:unnamed protein product, partial [Ixodes hexagonus]